jgi:two-component system, NtrC family, sensor kinase
MNDQPTIRVLLVDDEADFRLPPAKRLRRRGLTVTEASSGQDALDCLDEQPIDVVVLDVRRPGLDGLTVLPRIKESHQEIEVILLTGQATADDGVIGMKAGAFDYLTKPIALEHLVGKIRQAWEKIVRKRDQACEVEFRAKMESRMNATERLAALGTLAAGVAHEINNLPAVISEAAGWLKTRLAKKEGLSPKTTDHMNLALGKIEASVERAKRITHQLLSFARKTDSMLEEVDLAALVDEVAELTRKTGSEYHSVVETVFVTDQTRFRTDPYQLGQVLINLVTNGLQAVKAGGRVRIIVSENNDHVDIQVTDNGIGIPKENMERIFEPFFSTKSPGQGTGLGLSVSRGIVEKLGGVITFESRLGQGSTFRVSLPRRPARLKESLYMEPIPWPRINRALGAVHPKSR